MVKRASEIPAQPAVLMWARQYRGFSRADAASKLKVDEAALAALENGSVKLSWRLLERMAQVYRQSESALLLPAPPDTPPLPADYRTAGGGKPRPSSETIWAIREAQELQAYISALAEDEPEIIPHANLPNATLSDNAEAMARRERERFGIPIEEQLSWKQNAAWDEWRSTMQAQGILVLLKSLPGEDCRGFSLLGEGMTPAIVVNSQDRETARVFTLFHEYGHLMLRSAGLCLLQQMGSTRERTERWCNEFAAAFLMPKVDLQKHIERKYKGRLLTWTVKEIRQVSLRYKVSRAAAALRLQKLGLAPDDLYQSFRQELERYNKRPKGGGSGGRKPGWKQRQKLREIGSTAATAILDGWKGGLIEATEAADILDFSLDELDDFNHLITDEQRATA